ncbi:Pyoverdine biosynthesis protein OS=Tsukamurella paurometabola (strain ATCC 8368 / DSM / CCUG 35730 / CIP 100753 / JCM 10117 / KCTC 9821 / NBRC 16120 / NCIMB 702349 / NCTC 13040) OX=521096 GN=Tpau_3777 PE=4 SV=1 [Tsukamurella paurometabola]|uniref:Pyoverdine biosynthesis protein n=1 Tax=Tsukamurella paurometabola (strain ATCC 8368 / DSM 20162 / CCUG 35730 / CIP 100753 / JCM 10117 / KCTC 9821 / NBRC 16120 / NCIMB 702349 / NCTC 13040) TaxID=521096 RepID=D5UYQ2_TSUPD|nr:isocyanide synthase family protein [Tsukamurella paurometabola]ADG80355.1 Pyoverdine biosynthesis protein [Tsukamurella paurometabola DSM 20162]SUP39343.1 Pyoverdine/dityrosine biosynthesis protein [Tsukamurella paurometabola]
MQLAAIGHRIERNEPIDFVLPAFPCKSPNPDKVAGHLPDEGERLALRNLNAWCEAIGRIHPPGARVIVCSDGHVFTEVIGVSDSVVTAYNAALRDMIEAEGLTRLTTFGLDSIWENDDFAAKRERLEQEWAPPLVDVRADVLAEPQTARMLRGMTRFMVGDTAQWSGSRAQLQRTAKRKAYDLLRLSRAWGDLLAHENPDAVRLSIHPQPPGAEKFGIRLIDAADGSWATPWHAVLVYRSDGRPALVPHREARDRFQPVITRGRISHYVEALTT